MRLILLPGLDGTGELFSDFINDLSEDITVTCIKYPELEQLGYTELVSYVQSRLPINEDFIILAESFSGPIAFELAKTELKHLKAIIFVASFLRKPNRVLMWLVRILPLSIILRHSPPDFIIRKWLLGDSAKNEMVEKFKSILRRLPINIIKFRLREIYNLSINQIEYESMLNIPVYFIKPTNDRLVHSDNFIDFEKRCSNIDLLTVDGPHFILQNKAKACADYVNQLVNKLVAS